jgi:hypothetical protein
MIPESHHGCDGLASKVARHSGKIRVPAGCTLAHNAARFPSVLSGSANRRNHTAERHNRELKILQCASYALLRARQESRFFSWQVPIMDVGNPDSERTEARLNEAAEAADALRAVYRAHVFGSSVVTERKVLCDSVTPDGAGRTPVP